MSGPLEGIRVLELGTLIAAPFAARLFAEFGADVIKVESPENGDALRSWRYVHNGTSLWWYLQARNKKSIAIDMKSADGIAVVKRLAASADLVIENFRPGALEKLGLGWETLHALNPKLVMVRISGFGQTGPYRNRPGFGAIGEAMGGLRYVTGEPGRAPPRVGVSIGDSLAALHGVIGALMALMRVKTDQGGGQVVDVSLIESVYNMMESMVPEYDFFGAVRERAGGALPGISPSNTYAAGDGGYVVISGNSDPIFKRLMQVIGRADLGNDPALGTNPGRVQRNAEIDAAIAAWAARHSTADVLARLEAADVPAGRLYSVADIVADPHFQARGMIQTMTLPTGEAIKVPGIVPKLSETPGEVKWTGPVLGQHSAEVLADLGYNTDEIEALKASGAVRCV
jgi:crotonobetainyl-CoA:carnitine CoA-transferase CaiB-like acyl-CoA transferase